MDEKSIELKYDSLMNQFMSCKYFLFKLGFNIEDECKIEHKSILYNMQYKDCYSDDLYYNFSNLVGITSHELNDISIKYDSENVMNAVLSCVMSLLELKMVISQDLLMLCAMYCTNTPKNLSKESNNFKNKFIQTLMNVTKHCLQSGSLINDNNKSNKSKKSKLDTNANATTKNSFKQRNYQWFKMFLLHSNIWLAKTPSSFMSENSNTNTTSDNSIDNNNTILFDNVIEIVNEELMQQKQFIWNNIKT